VSPSLLVIPGPPQAEPGIQAASVVFSGALPITVIAQLDRAIRQPLSHRLLQGFAPPRARRLLDRPDKLGDDSEIGSTNSIGPLDSGFALTRALE
jgi:hypothetical protein